MREEAPYRGRFVLDYSESYPKTGEEERQEIMGFYERGTLPALHALAEQFTICDRWFASVPGPTWTNRFFVHTGTSLGIVRMPDDKWDLQKYDLYDQTTVYDRLNEKEIPWRIYYHDVPQSLALTNQLLRENKERYRKIKHFEADAAGSEIRLSSVCLHRASVLGAGSERRPSALRYFRRSDSDRACLQRDPGK